MSARLGKIKANLAFEDLTTDFTKLVELINHNINPADEIKEEDVYIRAMYIVSDEINSFGGRFPVDELNKLVNLLIDSPVLIGHRKDKLPIGRNFHAKIEKKDNRYWVKSYFYWLKKSDFNENLKENIDGGIYKECSIGFTFYYAECSACGKDIRICRHEPFKIYNNSREKCYFNYRKIEKVLETSLVYRGAVPNTLVTKKLSEPFESDIKYLVTPNYNGLPIKIVYHDDRVSLLTEINFLNTKRIETILNQLPLELIDRFGFLIGYRGKERCSKEQLMRYLDNKPTSVTHIELKLLPEYSDEQLPIRNDFTPHKIETIRHRFGTYSEVEENSKILNTKEGALLIDLSVPDFFKSIQIIKNPDMITAQKIEYNLSRITGSDCWLLCIYRNNQRLNFKLISSDGISSLEKTRTPAELLSAEEIENMEFTAKTEIKGYVDYLSDINGALCLRLEGGLHGNYIMRPIVIDQSQKYLFYKINGKAKKFEWSCQSNSRFALTGLPTYSV